jgi:hypothetical protein
VTRVSDTSRLLLGLAAILAIVSFSGCGSDDPDNNAGRQEATGPTGPSQPGGATAENQPAGSLSQQEYGLVRRAIAIAERAGKAGGAARSVNGLGRACKVLANAPTPLVREIYDDCLSTFRFLEELLSVPRTLRSCGAPTTEVSFAQGEEFDPACFKRVLDAILERTQAAIKGSNATNQALAERKIHGRCRRALGTSEKDLRILSEIADSTKALDGATDSSDKREINRAVSRFQKALDRLGEGSEEEPLQLVRGCRR